MTPRRPTGFPHFLVLALLSSFALQASEKVKIADGIYQFITAGHGDVGFDGNSTVIISDDGVLVFDTNCVPSTAAEILKEIRQLTNQPVKYVVNSHWHWDHWSGNQVYKAAFPNVQIISSTKNRDQMRNVSLPRNEGSIRDLKAYLANMEKRLADLKAEKNRDEKADARIARTEKLLAEDKQFLAEKQSLTYTYPNVTFSESMTVFLGDRRIELTSTRAITPGDTFLFLPNEKIVITGDILVNPIPFAAGGCFPADWVNSLQRIGALDFETLIPGHGTTKQGKQFLMQNLAMFESVIQDVKDAKAKGATAVTIAKTIGEQLDRYVRIVGLTDPRAIETLRPFFLDIFASRAFAELEHPLSDMPDDTSK